MGLREEKKIAAWRAIRAAALRLFEEQGYAVTTVEQIAEAANISRATFFNYFDGKEAVVFDQDPGERDSWRAMMAARPDEEPLWDALSAVMAQFVGSLRDRMPLQRRLKKDNPTLARSTQTFGNQFREELERWALGRAVRTGMDQSATILQLNLVAACTVTAYQTWRESEDFDALLDHLRRCLDEGRPTIA